MTAAISQEQSDRISPLDVVRQLPFITKRLPSIAKGYYFYALLKADKPLAVGNIVEQNADKYGHRPAVYYQDSVLTYRELNAWANQVAHYLAARGIGRGDVIALAVENRPELLAVLIGALKLGAACAMINTSQRGHVLAHSLKLTKPKLIVVGEEQLSHFESARNEVNFITSDNLLYLADRDTRVDPGTAPAGFINLAEAVEHYSEINPVVDDRPVAGDTAVYLFTSGTTGLPKATPCSHLKWFRAMGGLGHMSLSLTPDDVMYITLPLYHGTGLVVCWGATLLTGASIVIRRKFSASEFWADIRKYQATCFGYVGELCRYLLNQPPQKDDPHHTLRKMVGNGLRPSIWRQFKQRFGIEQISELYGASEGNIGFSNFLNLDNTVGFSTAPFALVKFHEGTREPIRNAKGKLEKVAKGEPGLLLGKITDQWAFEGYTQTEETEKAIVRGAFDRNDAWFNTGDVLREIGCRHLQFVDRMGDTFRWKGENVSTTEVENTLDRFGDISEAIVYGVEIPGTNGKAGMATIVSRDGSQQMDMEKLLTYLQQELPAYAIPVFIRLTQSIEKTGTFKYRKVDLKEAGYQLNREGDQVYVYLPGTHHYQELTSALIRDIEAGQYRF
ncbi:long-chain-acyl-CoA synthetase [Hahella sp. CCB-MM4]|uniref:long-chain-acyl-CoA synthetase n=1 Tax=Hahella sp. (strain CCB-MM4) TaxID=1926491 RepID=UPI000B9B41B9|nr:long-chain-acyl-CoA synthetase [Hahella sp. CCB-MM4]OZG71623.1 long-chain-acyl-CoA synthetase [Hahella sp. CCB-MM4]